MDRPTKVVNRDEYQRPRITHGVREANSGLVPDDVVSRCVGMVELQVKRGNFDAAHSAIDAAQSSVKPRRITRNTPLTETDMDMRSLNALERQGIVTIGQLLNCTREQLLSMTGLGGIRVERLIDMGEEFAQEIVDGENA